MLPWWFAEYTLYFDLTALLLFIVVVVFGYVAPSTNSLISLMTDVSCTRRPSTVISVVALLAGIVVLGLGISASTSHFGLAMSGLGSALLLVGITAAVCLPMKALWTNTYWKLPSPDSLTASEARALARTMGRVYSVVGMAGVIAVVGGLIGIIPKLVYVGEVPIRTVFVVADFVLTALGGFFLFRGWRLFQSLRVNRAPAH